MQCGWERLEGGEEEGRRKKRRRRELGCAGRQVWGFDAFKVWSV